MVGVESVTARLAEQRIYREREEGRSNITVVKEKAGRGLILPKEHWMEASSRWVEMGWCSVRDGAWYGDSERAGNRDGRTEPPPLEQRRALGGHGYQTRRLAEIGELGWSACGKRAFQAWLTSLPRLPLAAGACCCFRLSPTLSLSLSPTRNTAGNHVHPPHPPLSLHPSPSSLLQPASATRRRC